MRGWAGGLIVLVLVVGGCASPQTQPDPNHMTAPMSAEEVAREALDVQARTPLPPGSAWTPIELKSDEAYGPYSGGSIVEFQALCAWLETALAARDADERNALAEARAQISNIPRWRSFSDPTLGDVSFRTFVKTVTEDAQRSEMTVVRQFVEANCEVM